MHFPISSLNQDKAWAIMGGGNYVTMGYWFWKNSINILLKCQHDIDWFLSCLIWQVSRSWHWHPFCCSHSVTEPWTPAVGLNWINFSYVFALNGWFLYAMPHNWTNQLTLLFLCLSFRYFQDCLLHRWAFRIIQLLHSLINILHLRLKCGQVTTRGPQ